MAIVTRLPLICTLCGWELWQERTEDVSIVKVSGHAPTCPDIKNMLVRMPKAEIVDPQPVET